MTSAGRGRWKLIAAGGLAGACLVWSVVTLIALNAGGAARLGPITLEKIAVGYDRRAVAVASRRLLPTLAEGAEVARLSREAVRQYPYDTPAWMRLAAADVLAHGRLTQPGIEALKHSYDLVAVDQDFGTWRVRFALEYANDLTPSLLQQVRYEATTLARDPAFSSRMRDVQRNMRNPTGRAILFVWLNTTGRVAQ